MRKILTDIQARLLAAVPALKYVDMDWGQLDYFNPHPPVKWPVALIDVSNADWQDVLKGAQRGRITLRIRVADLVLSNSSGAAPQAQKDKSFAILDLITGIHQALHGWAGDKSYSKLLRATGPQRIRREDGLQVYELSYTTALYDASATPHMATAAAIVPELNAAFIQPVVPDLNAEADAFFSAVEAGGGLLGFGQKTAVNNLVRDLKAAGIWSRFIALYPFTGGSAAAHKVNLASPGVFDLTFYGSPTHTDNGTYFASVSWADTGIISSVSLALANKHIALWSQTVESQPAGLIGSKVTGTAFDMLGTSGNSNAYAFGALSNGDVKAVTNSGTGKGFFLASRRSAATLTLVAHEVSGDFASPATSQNATPIVLANVNNYPNPFECAFMSVGYGLLPAEIADYRTALTNFQTALGR